MKHFVLSSFVLVSLATGCAASSDDTVGANVEVIGKGSSALSASGISAINGTYGALCNGHSDGEAWSAGANGNASLTNAAVSVRRNDGDCTLRLTSIEIGTGVSKETYLPSSNITLATSWGDAASFKDLAEDPIDFYGNAMISSATFASDFTITVKVSADHNDAESGSKTGTFATQSASVTTENLAAPNYTVSMESFSFQTDNEDVVQSTSGSAQLSLAGGEQSGQDYAVYHGQLSALNTPEEVASAYAAAAVKDEAVGDGSISHDKFGLDTDDDLTSAPAYRTLIIRNSEVATGLVSYQLIEVAFNKP